MRLEGHSELALYVDTFEEVDAAFRKAVAGGAEPVPEPETEPWGREPATSQTRKGT